MHFCNGKRGKALLAGAILAALSLADATLLGQTPASTDIALTRLPPVTLITSGGLDALVAREAPRASASQATINGAFLRRASFDLVGRQPTLAEQQQFDGDTSPSRQRDLVERLLASPEFGANWANYWSDTIAYHVPPPELTYLDYRPLKGWLAGKLNGGAPWDEVVRALITAKGKIADEPAATFVGYHQANPTNLAAETSRIFLGQQILCAQCHDHPFDHWKRTEFHALAAFFARTKAKLPWNDGPATVVSAADKGEYVMPDAADPANPGSKMKPAFLAHEVANEKIGKDDDQRRSRLADFITSKDNPWFAKAYVNRVWSRLMGRGFFEPVDDLGDSREPALPQVLDALAGHFVATGYDVKDLFRLIANSETYALGARIEAAGSADNATSASATADQPLRLRGDEIFTALAVGIELPNVTPPAVEPTGARRFPPPPASTQDLINAAFGTDPSLVAADAPRTMLQALWMMNNEQLAKQINAAPNSGTMLAKLLDEVPDDRAACERLYSRVLARKATADELRIALAHVASVGDRRAAFEDLLWSLVNSAEFTTRR